MSWSVLVVDDDPTFRKLAGRMLIAFGLAVAGEAENAATGLAAANALRPDAVIVDVGLPDRDGIALASDLAALPWHPRVLLTSTDAEAVTAADLVRSGAAAFLPKHELPSAALNRLLGDVS